nr:MAG TPA: hypothetical protein [Caudoviricetes sp.]
MKRNIIPKTHPKTSIKSMPNFFKLNILDK